MEGIFHQEELDGYLIDFEVTRVELLYGNSDLKDYDGDITEYLQEFSKWQDDKNAKSDSDKSHWDHAIMLSG